MYEKMRTTYCNAIHQALYDELKNDTSVVLFGEDIRYNLYGYTDNLVKEFGTNRIIDIPLSEASVMGMACGCAMRGLRPILDLTVSNFLYVAMDQIASIAAKTRYMYNGAYSLPLTILCSNMNGGGNAAQHSDRLHSLFMNIPGLIIICPASPQDMYSMLREAIRNDNPVLCFADRTLFWLEDDINISIGQNIGHGKVLQEGNDITIVTVSSCLQMVKTILPDLERVGISADIIDIRSVVPLDFEIIKKSVAKTGRAILCDTANRTGSVASEISALISEYAFEYLKAPVKVVAGADVPVPFSKVLEKEVLVTKEKILNTILTTF